MRIGSISGTDFGYQTVGKKQAADTIDDSGAVTEAAAEGEGMFLGLTMIPEEGQSTVYGMRAILLEESTFEKPIVQVISNLNGQKEVFDIDISQVDPQNATRMEMFALCSFADSVGQGTGSSFGSFKTLEIYEETAKQNGCMKQVDIKESAWEQFRTEKVDWMEQMKNVCAILQACTDSKALDLFSKGKKLLSMFENYSDMASSVAAGAGVQYMNIVQCSVCSMPDSGISFYYNHSTGVLDCVDDTSSKKGRDILWSKMVSKDDYDRCAVLFEKYKGETTWEYKYEAYLADEEFWDKYLNHEFDEKALNAVNEQLTGNFLSKGIFRNCPDTVKAAWENALMEVGNVFSTDADGKVRYFSELHKQIFLNAIKGNGYEILGNTEEEAISFAQSAMERLAGSDGYNYNTQHMREKEKKFYEVFIRAISDC
jgi:hypothetical protein